LFPVENCPAAFDNCALITTTVTFQHLKSVENLILEKDVLTLGDDFGDTVTQQSNFPVQHVITLDGIDQKMTELQETYFEQVSSTFFADFSTTIPIYEIEVMGQSVRSRRLATHNVRGSSRLLASALEISVGAALDFQTAVLDTISLNTVRYVDEQALQHLRPGTINTSGNEGCGKLVAMMMRHQRML
jgi:hypothetical protein